jgi:glutathione peroxidase
MRLRSALLGATGVVAALVACTADPSPAPAPSSEVAPPAPAPPGPRPSDAAVYDPWATDAAANACNPPAGPGELYALSMKNLAETEDVSMCRYRGSVLLIVNVASLCGYTPQYAPLQTLYDTYKARGFYVLGFPSASFNQEYDAGAKISEFCTTTYKITFPMFTISNVNPPNENAIYTWLKSQPGQNTAVGWNFEKFLISRKGTVAGRFLTAVGPDSNEVKQAVEAELAK